MKHSNKHDIFIVYLDGTVTATGIVRTVPTRGIALLRHAGRISFDAMTANAFRVICNVAARLSATTRRTNLLATVSVFP